MKTELKPNDGDMQSALMPQELNPVFVPDSVTEALREILGDITRATNRSYALINLISKPWRSVIPLMPRSRRNSESGAILLTETSSMQQVKSYTRIFSCVVLAVAAVVELVIYCIESYYG